MAAPIPFDAPVTTATLPASFCIATTIVLLRTALPKGGRSLQQRFRWNSMAGGLRKAIQADVERKNSLF